MTRLARGRAGPLSQAVAEARQHARNTSRLAQVAWLLRGGPQLNAASRRQDVADKVIALETRFNNLLNSLGPINPGTGAGGNGQAISAIANAVPQSITGAVGTYTSITGLAIAIVIPGAASSVTYRFNGWMTCTQGGASTNQQNFRFTGPSTTAGRWNTASFVTAGAVQISSSAALSTANVSAAYAAGSTFFVLVSGWFTFTAAGTLQFQAGEGGAGGPFTFVDGTLDAWTVGATL